MSGSSLDGLDLAICDITSHSNGTFSWQITAAECATFSSAWVNRLRELPDAKAIDLAQADVDFSAYMGELVNTFLEQYPDLRPDYIASHGHTIFHSPQTQLSVQIGNGATLAAKTGLPTIAGFRWHDVALGGQGAPLAPLADMHLFPSYQYFLNLGGIANLSARVADNRFVAYDVCSANALLNFVANQINLEYDKGGKIASFGDVSHKLYTDMNALPYFEQAYPKSLSNQWAQTHIIPLVKQNRCRAEDKLATLCEHIAYQIALAAKTIITKEQLSTAPSQLLVTGGGAFNTFLLERLQYHLDEQATGISLNIPDAKVIQYKEALLMALLGVLRLEQRPNSLASVTGAQRDNINGGVFL